MQTSVPSIIRAWQKAGKLKGVLLVDNGARADDISKFLEQDQEGACVFDGNYTKLLALEKDLRASLANAFPIQEASYTGQRAATKLRANYLNRFLVGVDPKGDLLLSGRPPKLPLTLPRVIKTLDMPMGTLHSWPSIAGMRGAEEWEKHGIAIPSLGNERIYPRYSVFPPTKQVNVDPHKRTPKYTYIEALANHWKRPQFKKPLAKIDTALEVGSGTGVLSFLLNKHFARPKVWGVDINPEATVCALINMKQLRMKVRKFNFATANPLDDDNWREKVEAETSVAVPKQFDYIFANPPWLPDADEVRDLGTSGFRLGASRLHGAMWDIPSEDAEGSNSFISRLLRLAQDALAPQGRLCIVHSDLAALLLGEQAQTVPGLLTKFEGLVLEDVVRYDTLAGKDRPCQVEIWTVARKGTLREVGKKNNEWEDLKDLQEEGRESRP